MSPLQALALVPLVLCALVGLAAIAGLALIAWSCSGDDANIPEEDL